MCARAGGARITVLLCQSPFKTTSITGRGLTKRSRHAALEEVSPALEEVDSASALREVDLLKFCLLTVLHPPGLYTECMGVYHTVVMYACSAFCKHCSCHGRIHGNVKTQNGSCRRSKTRVSYLYWRAFSHWLFLKAPSKQKKNKRKRETVVQYKTEKNLKRRD